MLADVQNCFTFRLSSKFVVITFCMRDSQGEMYSGHGRLCLCLCLTVCPSPHSYTAAWTQMELGVMVGVPSSCALLGGFAIGAWLL